MYDDKKYSPCYSGYSTDIQFIQISELEQERNFTQAFVAELNTVYVILYRNLTVHLAS